MKCGMDLDTLDEDGNTALMIAAKEGQLKDVNRLITPNNEQVLNLLLEWKRSNHKLNKQYIEQWKKSSLSFMNNRNLRGETALWLCLNHLHLDISEILMKEGAKCNDYFNNIEPPITLMKAISLGHKNITKMLLRQFGDRCFEDDWSARYVLKEAAERVEEDIVREVSWYFRGNSRFQYGDEYHALISAAKRGFSGETICCLLNLGGNYRFNAADDAFIVAVKNNQVETVRYFLNNGLISMKKTIDIALISAAEKNFSEIVKLLIDKGADINSRSKTEAILSFDVCIMRDGGLTVLDFLRLNKNSELIRILKRARAKSFRLIWFSLILEGICYTF